MRGWAIEYCIIVAFMMRCFVHSAKEMRGVKCWYCAICRRWYIIIDMTGLGHFYARGCTPNEDIPQPFKLKEIYTDKTEKLDALKWISTRLKDSKDIADFKLSVCHIIAKQLKRCVKANKEKLESHSPADSHTKHH